MQPLDTDEHLILQNIECIINIAIQLLCVPDNLTQKIQMGQFKITKEGQHNH